MTTIRMDGSRGSGAPYSNWSTEKGIGYCKIRSGNHGRRLGHLFESKGPTKTDPVSRVRCSWCWKAKT